MTTSGTYDFTLTNGDIVIAAYERCKIRMPELRQEHMATARRELNLCLVKFGTLQPNLWKVEQLSINLVSGTATYSVPARVAEILDAWVTVNSSSAQPTDLYVSPLSRTEWASLANKRTPGRPTSYWWDRLLSPVLYPWPVPDNTGPYVFNYFAASQCQDANLPGGETPDVPYLWMDAIVAELAHRVSRTYSPPEIEAIRKADAKEAWELAAAQNTENVDVQLAPNLGGYYPGR